MTRPYRTLPFANVRREMVRWLWPGRIPLGKVTLLEGDGGVGKSTITTWLGARVSVGDLGGDLAEPTAVLMISAEDSASDTIRPRLETQGAVLERVHQLHDDDADAFALPEGVERLRRTIVSTGAKLVIIDPIASFLDRKVTITSDASVRRALGPLKDVAEDTGAAVLLVRHLNGQRNAPAYRRGLGGAALANIARSVLVVGLHPEDGGDPRGRRVVALVKGNLDGRNTHSVEFQLDENLRLTSGQEIMVSADELLANQPRAVPRLGRLDEAIAFLRHELDGHDVGVIDIQQMAESRGISERTLNRARDELGLRPRRAAGRWWLSLNWTTQNTPEPEPPAGPLSIPVMSAATPTMAAAPAVAVHENVTAPAFEDAASLRFSLLDLSNPAKATNAVGTLEPTPGSNGLSPRMPEPKGASAAS